ncbi:YCF48-related protein [Pseudomonas aeruginosa]|uniref:YCF48-related protein n=2 Tax=Pseudomonas aeruginosa group TaxID=136841 RepID=UPI0009357FD7|nr:MULTISPECIES: YCF48-related protein [Pseudomonas]MCS9081283.1 YCF48-related protein [Pseudomonas aeruginosa]MCT0697557.1 YCF48-related protein [Pseudomonas aeruginosa]MCU9208002.1 YCF48-related protein [Pseudomonas aeruginosa]MCV6227170.1 YCF48-related protein [Pseudomonas aeruginosa]MDH1209546.1 YCF48-related protein [Pseudomonas chengduensis]
MISPCLELIHPLRRCADTGMHSCRQWLCSAALVFLLPLVAATRVDAAVGSDSLDAPAAMIAAAVKAPVIGVAQAGGTLVSVGPRGLIQRSTDGGQSWQQVPSPVSSDLVQVRFSDERNGWIVGHDSVLLHTSDGGDSWQIQLDGRRLLALLQGWYGQRAEAGDAIADDMLREISMAMSTSATPDVLPAPFLDVLFDGRGHGFVVGAFGMILHSQDAGATWEPWIEHTDNDRRMHLYGLSERHGVFYVAGEQGLLMRLEPQAGRFVALEVPYSGTFFGVRALDDLLLVHGLRGNLFASRDDGQQWQKVETGLDSSLVSLVEQGSKLVVVSQDGQMVAVNSNTLAVTSLQPVRVGEIYAASLSSVADDKLVVALFSGARVVAIAKAD